MGDRLVVWLWNAVLIFMIGVGVFMALAALALTFAVIAKALMPIISAFLFELLGRLNITSWADFSGIATAIGALATLAGAFTAAAGVLVTVTAVCVALWVATRDSRWRDEERKTDERLAELYIMTIYAEMTSISLEFKKAINLAEKITINNKPQLNDFKSKVFLFDF